MPSTGIGGVAGAVDDEEVDLPVGLDDAEVGVGEAGSRARTGARAAASSTSEVAQMKSCTDSTTASYRPLRSPKWR
jgi:hypothetical protein